jgi:hypothetical protein
MRNNKKSMPSISPTGGGKEKSKRNKLVNLYSYYIISYFSLPRGEDRWGKKINQ